MPSRARPGSRTDIFEESEIRLSSGAARRSPPAARACALVWAPACSCVQRQVLDIMDKLVKERGMGLIFISHDLNLVADFCDRVLIMYAGRIVEVCEADKLHEATHPYTRGLLNSLPRLDAPRDRLEVLKRDPEWSTAPSVSGRV